MSLTNLSKNIGSIYEAASDDTACQQVVRHCTPPHASAAKVVEIRVLRTSRQADASVVARAFSLTPAQEAVINALMRTQSATLAVQRLGLSRETVKTHLQKIYGKTETGSLAQLMMLLGKFA